MAIDDKKAPSLGQIPKEAKKFRLKTPEELAAEKSKSTSFIGGEDSSALGSFVGNIVSGAANVLGAPFQAVDRALAAAADVEYRPEIASPIGKLGQGIEDAAAAIASPDPERQDQFVSQLGQGLGSTLGFAAPLGLLGAGARGAVGASALGGTATAVEQAEDYERTVKQRGGEINKDDQAGAFFAGIAPGLIEGVPLVRALGRLDNITKGGLKAAVKNTAKGTAEEAMQEGIQSVASNLIASDVVRYDEDRNMFFDTPEAAAVGGGVGFILNTAMSAFGLRQRGKYQKAAEQVAKSTREQIKQAEDTANVNPATGLDFENAQLKKTNKLINRYSKLAETDPVNADAYNRRVEELRKELVDSFFKKDEEGNYTSTAADRQEATDVLTGVGVEEVETIDIPGLEPAVAEAEDYPKAKGIRAREITSQKKIDKFYKDLEEQNATEEILLEAFNEPRPTTDGIDVQEVEPTIEEITLDTTAPDPATETFFSDRPTNTALRDALESVEEQRRLRENTDRAFEARKEAEITEAYRQRELQLADEQTKEKLLQSTATEPTPAPAEEQTQEEIRSPERETGVAPEGAIVTKSGKGYKSEAIAKAQMKRKNITGDVVEYTPGEFAIVPKEAQDGEEVQGQAPTEEVSIPRQAYPGPAEDIQIPEGPSTALQRQAGFGDEIPPLETTNQVTDDVPPSLRDRTGVPSPNGQPTAPQTEAVDDIDKITPEQAKAILDSDAEFPGYVIRQLERRAREFQPEAEADLTSLQTEFLAISNDVVLADTQSQQEYNKLAKMAHEASEQNDTDMFEDALSGLRSMISGQQKPSETIAETATETKTPKKDRPDETGNPTLQEGDVGTKDNKPFKTERAAKAARTRKGLLRTHVVEKVEGGYVLRSDIIDLDTMPELDNSEEVAPTDQDQVIKSANKENLSDQPIIEEAYVEPPLTTTTISQDIYDEVLAIAQMREDGASSKDVLARMMKTFDVTEFSALLGGIQNGRIVPAEEGYAGKQTPVGEVEDTTITKPEMPDPADQLAANKNQQIDIEDQLDVLEAQIAEAEVDGDPKQIAALKNKQKRLEAQQQELRDEEKQARKREEDELVALQRESEEGGFDPDEWEDMAGEGPSYNFSTKQSVIDTYKRVVGNFNKALAKSSDLQVKLVTGLDDLTPGERRFVLKTYKTRLPKGIHMTVGGNQKVWIFAKPGTGALEIQRTLFHEVVGHYGLQRLFKNDFDSFKDIAMKNPLIASKAYAISAKWGFDMTPKSAEDTMYINDRFVLDHINDANYHDHSRNPTTRNFVKKTGVVKKVAVSRIAMRKAFEEYLAEIAADFSNPNFRAAQKDEIGLLKRFVTWVRHFLRKSGFGKVVESEVTEDQLISLVAESFHRTLPGGKPINIATVENKVKTYMQNIHRGESGDAIVNHFEDKARRVIEAQAMVDTVIEEGSNINLFSAEDARNVLRSMNSYEGRIDTHPWQKFWNRQTDRIRRSKYTKHLSSLGHLTFPRVYNYVENIAKGSMDKGTMLAREWSRSTEDLNEVQRKAIYDYFTDPNASHTDLPVSTKIQNLAKKNKDFIEEMGEALVRLGVLSRKTYEQNKGSYLPLRYYKYLEGYYAGGKKLSLQNYLKKQEGLSDAEKQALGQIKDPSFLVAETVATLGRDVALRTMFDNMITISNEGGLGWVLGSKHRVEVLGKKMTLSDIEDNIEMKRNLLELGENMPPVWLEQGGIELIQQHLTVLETAKTEAEELMMQEAREVMINRGIPADQITDSMVRQITKAEYVRVDDRRYGRLYNKYVRKEIYDDIVDSGDFMNKEHTDFLAQTFGQGGTAERAHQYWKAGKVVLNPPSWIRNFIGNMVLLDIGSNTNSIKLTQMLMDESINNVVKKGSFSKYWHWAHEMGLFNTTYSAAELNLISQQFQDQFKSTVEIESPKGPFKKMFWMTHSKLHAALEKATNIYGGMEGLFKTVALRDHIETWEKMTGQSIDNVDEATRRAVIREGVEMANKNIFDYSKVPHWMRSMRRMPFVGAPFLTYTFKAIPQSIEAFARRPQKFIKYAIFPYAMMQAFLHANDLDEDDFEEIQRQMPRWMKEKSSVFLLPVKDSNGKWQAMDFGYYLPWAAMHNTYLQASKTFDTKNPVLSGGQAVLNTATDLGFLGGPFPAMISAALSNKDPFSGREIVRTAGTTGDKVNDFATYMLDLWIPTFLTSKGVLGRTMDNLGVHPTPFNTGRELTAYGSDRETFLQSSARGAGVNIYAVDPRESNLQNIKAHNFEKRKLETARRSVLKDRNTTPQEKAKKVREINEQIKLLNKKHRESLFGES